MYEITREMPARFQHLIKNKVYQAVSEVEAEYLQINTSSQYFSQPGPQLPLLHQLQPISQNQQPFNITLSCFLFIFY